MRGTILAALLGLAALPGVSAAGDDPLVRARQLYNDRRFELAVQAAEEARTPDRADSVDLIVARASLERFRESASQEDLIAARERLRRLNPERLNTGEQTEYLVGLGEHLFLAGGAGAAAAVFDSVLTSRRPLSDAARERILDWWATALDRDARPRAELDRRPVYQRILERMRDELGLNPNSGVAPYWIAAAAGGQGDHLSAWHAAMAAWVRSPLNPDHGAALRQQLDDLVTKVIVPQRARALAQPPEAVQQEWDAFKVDWAR